MEGLTQIRLVKILCLAVLLGVVIFFATNGFVAPGKGTINRPIVILGLSKISLNNTQTVGVQVDRVIRDCSLKIHRLMFEVLLTESPKIHPMLFLMPKVTEFEK